MRIFKFILIFFALLFSIEVSAQTFKIFEYNDYSERSQESIQKNKAKYLGSKITLEFYGNDVKLIDELDTAHPIVLTKVAENKYETTRGSDKCILTLSTWIHYIRSGELNVYRENEHLGKIVFKRD